MTEETVAPNDTSSSLGGRFAGTAALVVGGGWTGPDDFAIGVGGAICQLLAREGCRVAVLDIDESNAERTIAPIRREGGDAFPIVADCAREEDCERAVEEVITRCGRLDILINNVGTASAPGCEADSEDAFDRIMAVNFKGEILMARHAVPHMPRGGAIVNVGSVFGGVDPTPGGYAISKRAVSLVVTPTLAVQYAPLGIRVNCVTAGYIWNAVTQQVISRQAPGQSMDEYRSGRAQALNALGIEGDAWDVAKAVTFLASDDARWVTGQDFVVDGGYALLSVFEASPYGQSLRATQ